MSVPGTVPPGTRNHKGETKVENQHDLYQPAWGGEATKEDDFDIMRPWGEAKNLTKCTGTVKNLMHRNGFETLSMWNNKRGLLLILPDIREDGWDSVTDTEDADINTGEYKWKFGIVEPLGGLLPQTPNKPIKLHEDFQNNWIRLEEPFELETESDTDSIEHDFVRYPTVRGTRLVPTPNAQNVLHCLGMRMPHRAILHLSLSDIIYLRSHIVSPLFNSRTPVASQSIYLIRKGTEEMKQYSTLSFKEAIIQIFRKYRSELDICCVPQHIESRNQPSARTLRAIYPYRRRLEIIGKVLRRFLSHRSAI